MGRISMISDKYLYHILNILNCSDDINRRGIILSRDDVIGLIEYRSKLTKNSTPR